jgi:hypothetical protein
MVERSTDVVPPRRQTRPGEGKRAPDRLEFVEVDLDDAMSLVDDLLAAYETAGWRHVSDIRVDWSVQP